MLKRIKKQFRSTLLGFLYLRYKRFRKQSLVDFINRRFDSSASDQNALKRSMFLCYLFGGVRYSDYYCMRFEEKTLKEKMRFVPRAAELNLYAQVNDYKYLQLLEDKGECYELFKQYYHRDLVKVSLDDIANGMADGIVQPFLERHRAFIIKPLNLYCGLGIKTMDSGAPGFDLHRLYVEYPKGFVLEELISQSEELSALHSNSVNTVRLVTVNYGDCIEVKWPFLRVGRGDAIVDNAGAGGIICAVDDMGKVIAAADESRHVFMEHPESKVPLVGFELPKWVELCELTKEMASKCPDCHIMGWDMAYTEKGWVVVECNYGPNLVMQFATNKGVRDDFVAVRKRLKAKRYGKFCM